MIGRKKKNPDPQFPSRVRISSVTAEDFNHDDQNFHTIPTQGFYSSRFLSIAVRKITLLVSCGFLNCFYARFAAKHDPMFIWREQVLECE